MKRKTLVLLLAAAVTVLAVGGTLAYFTATKTATNTFTVGNVKIDLTEPMWDTEGSVDAPEAYPGEPLAKDPTITNTGANPCVVRIKVEWPASLPGDASAIRYRTGGHMDELGVGWYDGGDGYFYYLEPLKNPADTTHPDLGTATTPLFDHIVMPTDMTNGDAETDYNVVVTAEAVQAQGIFSKFADMADGISLTDPPTYSSTIEFTLVKQRFTDAFGH